ncbi:MAG: RNA ligase (ATP) [Desulfobacterales bacterium]|nr:RNA ligase (ATP) [Desulfobacterales bacterium]
MSNFAVQILPITVIPHPHADSLELGIVGATVETGFRVVIPKGKYRSGDLVAYLPEASIVPPALLQEMGLEGRLVGAEKNRIKAIKLRGGLSQGLVWAPENGWHQWFTNNMPEHFGDFEKVDVSTALGITKYVPPIPTNMAGKMVGDAPAYSLSFDCDSIKKFGDMFSEGEEVYITCKIHGSQISIMFDGLTTKISSKGVLQRNRATLAEDASNLYWQAFHSDGIHHSLVELFGIVQAPFQLIGEVYGNGVQDLQYGCKPRERHIVFFDMRVEKPNHQGEYLSAEAFYGLADRVGLKTVPLLYYGPFSLEKVQECTNGLTVLGGGAHIREGCVVRSATEDWHPKYGRKVLKSVSEAYLLRKGDVTEFE